MNEGYRFSNFGDLYRAAFAEPNPTVKQLLLAEVKKVLDQWAETIPDGMTGPGKPACSEVDAGRLVSFGHAA